MRNSNNRYDRRTSLFQPVSKDLLNQSMKFEHDDLNKLLEETDDGIPEDVKLQSYEIEESTSEARFEENSSTSDSESSDSISYEEEDSDDEYHTIERPLFIYNDLSNNNNYSNYYNYYNNHNKPKKIDQSTHNNDNNNDLESNTTTSMPLRTKQRPMRILKKLETYHNLDVIEEEEENDQEESPQNHKSNTPLIKSKEIPLLKIKPSIIPKSENVRPKVEIQEPIKKPNKNSTSPSLERMNSNNNNNNKNNNNKAEPSKIKLRLKDKLNEGRRSSSPGDVQRSDSWQKGLTQSSLPKKGKVSTDFQELFDLNLNLFLPHEHKAPPSNGPDLMITGLFITDSQALSETFTELFLEKGESIRIIKKITKNILTYICSTELYNLIIIDEDTFQSSDYFFDFLFDLKKSNKHFIITTSKNSFEHKKNLIRSGAMEYFKSPVKKEKLELKLHVIKMRMQQIKEINKMTLRQKSYGWFFNSIEHAMETIEIWSFSGHIQYVNVAHHFVSGYSRWEVIGTNIFSYFCSYVDIEFFVKTAWKSLTGKNPTTYKGVLPFRRKNGAVSIQDITISPSKNSNGTVKYFTVVKRDITEQKKIEDKLRIESQQAVEASNMKSKFLSQMSHDIRNPISNVIMLTNLLVDSDLNEPNSIRKDLGLVLKTAKNCEALLNDILDFSKIEAGKMDVTFSDFDLKTTVDDVVEGFYVKQKKGVFIVAFIDPNIPTWLVGDQNRITQILTNLVSNALKFTEKGSVIVRVTPTENPTEILFEVEDSGIGIKEEKIQKLFRPFVQTHDNTSQKNYGGTGLGLAICKQLVDLMGGKLGVKSVYGEGSTFWFSLPLAESKNTIIENIQSIEHFSKRIIVVDENPKTKGFMEKQLDYLKVDYKIVENLEILKSEISIAEKDDHPFHLCLIDIEHYKNAIPFAREYHSKLTIYLIVPFVVKSIESELRIDGISGIITKPIRYSQLYTCFFRIFSRRGEMRKSGKFAIKFLQQEKKIEKVKEKKEKVETTPRDPTSIKEDSQQLNSPSQQTQSTTTTDQKESSSGDNNSVQHVPDILVVDDNTINQKISMRFLMKLNCKVTLKSNGQEALDEVKKKRYDLIFMDCQMPVLDGFEATKQIRLWEEENKKLGINTPPNVIVALTGGAYEEDKQRCFSCGMDDYLCKPVTHILLQDKLKKYDVLK